MKIEKFTSVVPIFIILITLGIVAYFVNLTVVHNGGFNYPIDDAYIHMAIAKTFSQEMVWGVTSYQFSSATSSPLYTLLVSICFFLFGVNNLVPLIINTILVIPLVFAIWHLYLKQLTLFSQLLLLFFISLFTPIYALVLSGMEHIVHILLIVVYMHLMNLLINKKLNSGDKQYYLLFIIIALLGMARYESIFIILFSSFILMLIKDYKSAIASIICGFSPIVIYGVISKYMGEMFWPNSIVAKTTVSLSTVNGIINKISTLYGNFFNDAKYIGLLFFLILFAVALQLVSNKSNTVNKSLTHFVKQYYIQLLTLGSIIAHLAFGGLNWYYRYESYLIVMAFIAIVPLFSLIDSLWFNKAYIKLTVIASIMLIAFLPSASRFSSSIITSNIATINIYQQHIQMARFVNKYYNNASVALNDIGAVSFYSEIKLLDIFGLSDSKILLAKRSGPWKPLFTKLTKAYGVNIAIIYDSWYDNGNILPDSWIKVGEWEIINNSMCGDDVVSFYAVGDSNYNILVENFNDFKNDLDSNVIVRNY